LDTICVYRGDNHQEALSVCEVLESGGIVSIMPNKHISSTVPYYSLATGGFSVFVSCSQFIEAAELLHSLNYDVENKNLIDNLEEIKKEKVLEVCPSCMNESLESTSVKRTGLIIFLYALFGVPINAIRIVRYCSLCGYRSK
jgi:predicted nucleic-acid-binding Zn-ribbon protein